MSNAEAAYSQWCNNHDLCSDTSSWVGVGWIKNALYHNDNNNWFGARVQSVYGTSRENKQIFHLKLTIQLNTHERNY